MKRRDFLKIIPAAGISSFVLNGFTMRPFANSRLAHIISGCDDVRERALVLIQLKGGNDGLNNLVPLAQYSRYRALRPTTGLAENAVIELDSTLKDSKRVGLHPAMQALKDLYDRGWVSIVQGAGYPNPNQSHFKSTDLWLTGGDGTPANFNIGSGWMGRSLQALFPDVEGAPTPTMPDPLGIQVGDTNPSLGFHTETEHQNAINLSGQDPAGFYSLVQTIGGAPVLNAPDSEHGEELAYIMSVERSVNQYAKRITDVFNAGTNAGTYPNTALANQLKTVARLIRGGSKTKIFLCSIGGFDTHNAQVDSGDTTKGVHADLLRTLSEAIKAFVDDLDKMSIAHRAVVCTFSEFGRCAAENGSFGTDHGTLAPMYIVGKGVNPGVLGTNVNLSDLTADNQLKGTQHDYRQVFATLLQDWLGANNWVIAESLFAPYAKVPLISPAYAVDPQCYYGGSPTIVDDFETWGDKLLLYPNPARTSSEVFLHSNDAYDGILSVHSIGGSLLHHQRVRVEPGDNAFLLEVLHLPAGTYVVRLENTLTGVAKVAKMSVAR
ncbi:MAG: DUF1501 domain-containing protein [Saprospiraceae bacterium]|nr:DUF1501 domain-containing protein [Saprospiraceae bacterium]MDW8229870.1 DUF1501 domain-containing protein [Saprospiraceae bacterium]